MKKFICAFLFCILPTLSYSGELLQFKEDYFSEFTNNYREIEIADMAWKEGSLEKAWSIYSCISDVAEHPLFQSGIFLKKALLAHEMGLDEEAKENTLAFMQPFITESGLEISEDDLDKIIESAKNSIMKNAEKFKELFFTIYESTEEEEE
ncbi:MAG: hypothetical protein ACRCSV_01500 [Chlamydiales bacterium]